MDERGSREGLRRDIQFLRGLAVLAVVLYHAKLFPLAGGYLGVDIFFVISGFLITSIILRELDQGRFSFKRFYARRAKRLLPAAYSTLLVTTIASYYFLSPVEWEDYVAQLYGMITFSANLILPFQTGYFESAAEGKPLLHAWSLSLEEQYYLVTPLLLYLVAARMRLPLLVASTLASAVICVLLVSFPFTYWRLPSIDSTELAFYTLPARAWELLVGSVLAWVMLRYPRANLPAPWKLAALAVLCVLIVAPFDDVHPRGDAVVVVLATALLLLGNDSWLPSNLATRALERLGDWSYSLYLVHWPLFAYAHGAYLGNVPVVVSASLVLVALVLAFLQYRYVEQTFRYGWTSDYRRTLGWLAGASLCVLLLPLPGTVSGSFGARAAVDQFAYLDVPTRGLSDECAQNRGFSVPAACKTSEYPEVAVWGDSYAMHLVPGLLQDPEISASMAQLTKSSCAPVRGLGPYGDGNDGSLARECIAFNEAVLEWVDQQESIRYVVMSSPYTGYFKEGSLTFLYDGQRIDVDRDFAVQRLVETIDHLRDIGVQPVLVAPPPTGGFNVGQCWERQARGLVLLGREDCNIWRAEREREQGSIIRSLEEISRRTGVELIGWDDLLCGPDFCRTRVGGVYVYRDGGHLTVEGSELLVPQLKLGEHLASGGIGSQ